MRIISLFPSATETLCALGLADDIVGISHACDYPQEIIDRPRVTASLLHDDLSSQEIHERVQSSLTGRSKLYSIDTGLLAALEPDLIVSQEQCSVCAVGMDDVTAAMVTTGFQGQTVALSA